MSDVDMKGDPVLEGMANELHAALVASGADPKNPPAGGMPADRAFAEYRDRGGVVYDDPQLMVRALVDLVKAHD
jgi:hypothetical protein